MIGVYQNDRRARQLIRFDGMVINGKCFTDFDAVMEYGGKAWLLFEVKSMGKDMPTGQKVAIERFVQDTARCGKYAAAVVVEHDVVDARKDIMLSECMVRSVYDCKTQRWRSPKKAMTAKQLMRDFVSYLESEEVR